jgi:hypothetical protein
MYAAGVRHNALTKELVQVWRALDNGDLLAYDGERTRKLSDRIMAYRAALVANAALAVDHYSEEVQS